MKKFLGFVERVGNKLPHPVVLFIILSAIVMFVSAILAAFNYTVVLNDNEAVVKSLLSEDGIQYIFSNAISNFTGFAPLGVVLVAMLGVGIAEKSGLIDALIRKSANKVPSKYLSYAVVFIGILSNVASDAGYVVLIPLAAILFAKFGRHPLAGIAAAFAGVSGGFSANLIFGSTDALLSGITASVEYGHNVGIMSNWIFMLVSVPVITLVGGLITDKIVEPRLGEYDGPLEVEEANDDASETRGLKFALGGLIGMWVLIIWFIIPVDFLNAGALLSTETADMLVVNYDDANCYAEGAETFNSSSCYTVVDYDTAKGMTYDTTTVEGETLVEIGGTTYLVLEEAENLGYFDRLLSGKSVAKLIGANNTRTYYSLAPSPAFLGGIVFIIALLFAIPGLFYGIGAKTIKNNKDFVKCMESTMSTMGGYLVLAFFAAQFIAFFNWSGLGTAIAFGGANLLSNIGIDENSSRFAVLLVLIAFVFVSGFINLFIGSASAKWAIMAPVFVPMFALSGIDPEWTQLAYRIGDSSTNIITPLMSYFAIIIVFAQKYPSKAQQESGEETGIGTLTSMMLPYSIAFLLAWTVLMSVWFLIGAPIGINLDGSMAGFNIINVIGSIPFIG